MSEFRALLWREIQLATRGGAGTLLGLAFFLILIVALPLGIGPDLNQLSRLGPAFIWIGALLSTLLGLDRMFQSDYEDGALDLMSLTDFPLEVLVLAKCLGHWLTNVLPLVLAAPLFALFLNMPPIGIGATLLTLLVGTPAITLIGAIGAGLTVSLRRAGMLLAILIIPLMTPIIIFGVGAANATLIGGAPFRFPFLMLCAISLAALALSPFATAAALRASRG
ncbi:MAG: heme exporter protein CcmB [Pseudomonadota bacterium]